MIGACLHILEVRDLVVKVGDREVVRGVDLTIERGEVHALFGPNGSGKTSLLMAIMGMPQYKIVRGKIFFKGEDITEKPMHERVKMGIAMCFQRPPKLKGLKLGELLNICAGSKSLEYGDREIEICKRLGLPIEYLDREVNVGFSGGEIRRAEIMQLIQLNPELAILDEPDSGVDIESLRLIGRVLNNFLQRNIKPSQREKAAIIVTHHGGILEHVSADRAHVIIKGKIVCSGSPGELLSQIRSKGYEACVKCLRE